MRHLRMTIDVALFDTPSNETLAGQLLSDAGVVDGPETRIKHYPFGNPELARRLRNAIAVGDVEIDDVSEIEDLR